MIELLSLQPITPRKHDTLSQFSDNIFQAVVIMDSVRHSLCFW